MFQISITIYEGLLGMLNTLELYILLHDLCVFFAPLGLPLVELDKSIDCAFPTTCCGSHLPCDTGLEKRKR